MPALVTLVLVLGIGFARTQSVRAQPARDGSPSEASAGSSAAARDAFERGIERAGASDWDAALGHFRRSYAALPRARTLFNVAVALDRLDRGPECLAAIRALFRHDEVDPADRAEAELLQRRWQGRLGRLVLQVEPANAEVLVDGVLVAGEGAQRRIWLEPGRRRVRVDARGPGGERRLGGERSVEVVAGREVRVAMVAGEGGLGVAGTSRASVVRLRPIDRATLRLIGIRGARTLQDQASGGAPIVPLAAHGSGVAIGAAGWVLTARHVVEGADFVVALLPGQTRAIAAQTVWMDDERDLALVRLSEAVDDVLELVTPPTLEAGKTVEASGYPLDPVERWPNASQGAIGRPLNDGRVQLSIALNPGNSGGPIAMDEQLIGIVSQGGDPERGVQGIAIMEPLGPVAAVIAGQMFREVSPPEPATESDVLVELVGAAAPPPLVRRVARLRAAAARDPSGVLSAIWALEAAATRRAILGAGRTGAGVARASALAPEHRAQFDEVSELAQAFCSRLGADPTLAARYEPLRALSAESTWQCGPGSYCGGAESPDRRAYLRQGWIFDLSVGGGLIFDKGGTNSPVDGGHGSVVGLFRVGQVGTLEPGRLSALAGLELSVGRWRRDPEAILFLGDGGGLLVSALVDLGVRLEAGSPERAWTFGALYTPGLLHAEGSTDLVLRGFRVMTGVQFRSFSVGVSWRALRRRKAALQRSVELQLTWGIGRRGGRTRTVQL